MVRLPARPPRAEETAAIAEFIRSKGGVAAIRVKPAFVEPSCHAALSDAEARRRLRQLVIKLPDEANKRFPFLPY